VSNSNFWSNVSLKKITRYFSSSIPARKIALKNLIRTGVSVLMILFLSVSLCYGQSTAEEILARGFECGAKGKLEDAKEKFEKALEVSPFVESAKESLQVIEGVNEKKIEREAAIHLFGGAAHVLKDLYDEAIDKYNKALEIDPRFVTAYRTRGKVYLLKGQHDIAISDYTKAIELNPRYAQAYFYRAHAYQLIGELDKAVSDYTKAIEINPRYAAAYNNRGNIYERKGQSDMAFSDYIEAIELNPRLAVAYVNRGLAYSYKGRFDQAISDSNKAIELNPNLAMAYVNRGGAYAQKGQIATRP
jgi:tetratricopeptide (TPR) repeat protein